MQALSPLLGQEVPAEDFIHRLTGVEAVVVGTRCALHLPGEHFHKINATLVASLVAACVLAQESVHHAGLFFQALLRLPQLPEQSPTSALLERANFAHSSSTSDKATDTSDMKSLSWMSSSSVGASAML